MRFAWLLQRSRKRRFALADGQGARTKSSKRLTWPNRRRTSVDENPVSQVASRSAETRSASLKRQVSDYAARAGRLQVSRCNGIMLVEQTLMYEKQDGS